MNGFTTSKDRLIKATGADSNYDWSQVPTALLQAFVTSQQKEDTGVVVPQNCYQQNTTPQYDNTIIISGKVYQLTEILQIFSVGLQLISIIITLIIASRINK